MKPTRDDVIKANISLHTQLANVYKDTEPHYRTENRVRVENILSSLSRRHDQGSLLDVGCGMGFIIDIAKNHFSKITGIDVTQAMLDRVDPSPGFGEVTVRIAEIENMPFAENEFDIVTAYAVIHHLHSLEPAFREIYRVLKPGGSFYTDTDPNFYFWDAMRQLPDGGFYSGFVTREIDAVKHKDKELEEQFGVPVDVLNVAEILKHDGGGFKAEELERMLKLIGFSQVEVCYEWFIGEARVIHSDDTRHCACEIRKVLNEMLPLTKHLFKYLRIMACK
jgi:ubiquinone/menaquinone biosynthesis C-methylase UbiE